MRYNHERAVGVGLIGFGTVGTGVVRYFQEGRGEEFNVCLRRICVADLSKPRAVQFSPLTDKPSEIFEDPKIDIVVELMGGIEPAKTYILDAMDKGNNVVTANKAVLSRHAKELFDAARSRQVNLGFEASVGGGIQILSTLHRLKGERKDRIIAIANGTTNYILTKMTEEGSDFEPALKGAQEAGFAEANHILDTGGFDPRDKLAVLTSLAWNTQVDVEKIPCRGILEITASDIAAARDLGYTIKLLAIANRDGGIADLRVTPALIRNNHPFAVARNEYNIIYTEGELAGPQMHYGKGAGEGPTASAVISDILDQAENIRNGIFRKLPQLDKEIKYADPEEVRQKGYIRVGLIDEPGSLHAVTGILARRGLNLKNSIQREESVEVIEGHEIMQDVITFNPPAPTRDIDSALKGLKRSSRVSGNPVFLPIIDFAVS